MKKEIVLALSSLLFFGIVNAQHEWKNWNGISVQMPVGEKFNIRAGHTKAYNLSDKYRNEFNQTTVQAGYNLNRKWGFTGGVQFIKPVSASDSRKRYYIRGAYTSRHFQKKVNWTNSLRLEHNSKNERRFRQRIIVSSRLAPRKRLDFLHLSPSVMYTMFYNIGGSPIRYYDANSILIDSNTPDGFHRGRLTVNLNSKINEYLRLNIYLMTQTEFNFFSKSTNKINVYDPVRNRTLRPYNNFSVIGASLNISLNELFEN